MILNGFPKSDRQGVHRGVEPPRVVSAYVYDRLQQRAVFIVSIGHERGVVANLKCEHGRRRSNCSICSAESVWKMYRHKSVKRKLRFELTLEQFAEIVERPCIYCGEQYEPRGIDRRNNKHGYTLENSRACCGPCNKFKGVRDEHEFLSVALKIAKHQEALQKQKIRTPVPVPTPGPIPIEKPPVEKLPAAIRVPEPILSQLSLEARRFLDGF